VQQIFTSIQRSWFKNR